MENALFRDREAAGALLAKALGNYRDTDSVVLAVPRGGVPVGEVVARSLNLPLDIILSKKIGHPNNSEYAIGSVTLDSVITDEHPEVPGDYIAREAKRIQEMLQLRYRKFMGSRKPISLTGKNVIVIDDGIATGNTLLATVKTLRKRNPEKIIIAVPVAPADTIEKIGSQCDVFICLLQPEYFTGVGAYYENFDQVEDTEVIRILENSERRKLHS